MGRPFYGSERDDYDLDWLISNFYYENPNWLTCEPHDNMPIVLIPQTEKSPKTQITKEKYR